LESIGCRSEAPVLRQGARSQSSSKSHVDSSALLHNDADPTPFVGKHAPPTHGDPRREVFLSTYRNLESGVSFRYPRNYALEEGDVQEHSFFLKTQEDLDVEQPGATLVATVQLPEDGYPNTTFEHGSLQLVMDESVTEEACRDGAAAQVSASASGSTPAQGTAFSWTEETTETGGVKLVERTYAGYFQGACFQFHLSVAADEAPGADSFQKPADISRIIKQLEKIISSTQFFKKSVTPPPATPAETADRL
jgi:hypothetical protein